MFLLAVLNFCNGQLIRNAVTDPARLWPNGRVPYAFHDSVDAYRRVHIMAGMKQIMLSTYSGGKPCIYFVPRTNEADYIQIEFADSDDAAGSAVGRVGGKQVVKIHRQITQDNIAMEFMFVLGVNPEVGRPDRNNALDVVTSNINPAMMYSFQIEQNTDTFRQMFDYDSVVMYGPYTAAIDPSLPTIKTKYDGYSIGQAVSLSRNDVNLLQHIYKCPLDSSHNVDVLGPLSFECHFHTDFCQFQQDTSDDFDWVLQQGPSSTLGTGPNADQSSGSGSYALAIASGNYNKIARLITPTFPAGEYCIVLWLYAYGSDIGKLRVIESNVDGDKEIIKITATPISQWYHGSVTVTSVDSQFTLKIEARMGNGDIGNIAIDDIYIYRGQCIDWF